MRRSTWAFALLGLVILFAPRVLAQAVGGAEGARPVEGDPGISSMVVTETPQFRVLRDFAEDPR